MMFPVHAFGRAMLAWSAPLFALLLASFCSLARPQANAEDRAGAQSAPMSPAPSAVDDPLQNGKINDDDPESSVLTPEQAMKNPLNMGYLMMALADRADRADQRGDYGKEAKYYRAIAKAAPDRAIGYRRACAAHDKAGEFEQAIDMCRRALGGGGVTTDDHLKFLNVLLKRPGAPSETDIADADAVVDRLENELKLKENDAGRKVVAEAKCQIAAKVEDGTRLQACVEQLRAIKAEPAKSYSYQWALAVAEGDAEGARTVIANARKAGLPAAALQVMEQGLVKAKEAPRQRVLLAVWRRWWPALGLLPLIWFAVIAILRRSRPQVA